MCCLRSKAWMREVAQGQAGWVVHEPRLNDAFGVHHSKAFLAEYEGGLRVIVHTSNLIHQVLAGSPCICQVISRAPHAAMPVAVLGAVVHGACMTLCTAMPSSGGVRRLGSGASLQDVNLKTQGLWMQDFPRYVRAACPSSLCAVCYLPLISSGSGHRFVCAQEG